MITPDNSSRRLHLVDDNQRDHDDDRLEGLATPEAELTAKQAAAFAALVAEENQSAISYTLEQMSADQLRALAVALATQVNAAETAAGEVADVGPEGVCSIAVAAAAQAFGTTRDAVIGADRHRAVTDARAVAMTAARRGGLTTTAIASFFGKDHTTVMYNLTKVANNPRLEAVCTRIVDQLEDHYATPASVPSEDAALAGNSATTDPRSSTLQLAALEQARNDSTRRRHDEDTHRVTVAAAPTR
ncbi:helix-turn-helix domain-containing protein [Nocardioides cheoyonin]|uniref:helix-turn-helix domain-containing protein n=1 Tax=Nocardioides cheoyonin TaxID=3156615 RepID=UPI0032B4D3D7